MPTKPAPVIYHERDAAGDPTGLLVLHHGRGSDERDLLPIADAVDPYHALHVVLPRAPFRVPGAPGHHWYRVPRVGYPDPETFFTARSQLAALHDELWQRLGLGPDRTVLGGFSMGTVMSYALGLSSDRPAPAGILAFSGFIPTVDGWKPELDQRSARTKVLIAHGRRDPVIDVSFARRDRQALELAGFEVDYRESAAVHAIDPADIPRATRWLQRVISA